MLAEVPFCDNLVFMIFIKTRIDEAAEGGVAASREEFDRVASEYREQVARALPRGVGEVDSFARIKAWHLAELIGREFPGRRDVSVLDAGCGIGLTDGYLRRSYPDITGFDISARSVELAREANPGLRYESDERGEFPFPDGSFDVVFAICVMHHVPVGERLGFLRRVSRVLRPGGLMAVYEHNPWNPGTRWVVSRCEFDRGVVLLSSGDCGRLAREAGFRSVRSRHVLFLPLESPGWCRLERNLLSWMPFGAQYELTARR